MNGLENMIRGRKIICQAYADFIKSKPCMISHRHIGPVDAHHLVAQGWRQAKRNDLTAVNLCRAAHSEIEQIGVEKFQDKYQVNVWRESAWLLIEWFTVADDPVMTRIKKQIAVY